MMELFRNWWYWHKQGQNLRASLDTARRTLPASPTKPRRKRGFFFSRFPVFWTKP